MLILKDKLESREDFSEWKESNKNYLTFASSDDEPVNYPCVVVYYLDENDFVLNADVLTYEFVYLSDFNDKKQ